MDVVVPACIPTSFDATAESLRDSVACCADRSASCCNSGTKLFQLLAICEAAAASPVSRCGAAMANGAWDGSERCVTEEATTVRASGSLDGAVGAESESLAASSEEDVPSELSDSGSESEALESDSSSQEDEEVRLRFVRVGGGFVGFVGFE